MSQTTTIEQTLRAYILREFLPGEDPGQLTDSTPLITTGILDSIATLKLVAFLEQQFRITLEAYEADPEHLDTIERVAGCAQEEHMTLTTVWTSRAESTGKSARGTADTRVCPTVG